MSKINATFNINSNDWTIESVEPNPFHTDLNFIFTTDTPDVEFIAFNDLSFGVRVTNNEHLVFDKFFPTYGVKYETATKGSVFEKTEWSCYPESEYVINLWLENNGERVETSYTHTTPRPIPVFSSWTWDATAKKWIPPIPHPEGPLQQWNEDLENWEEIKAEIDPNAPLPPSPPPSIDPAR
jgi:hypothetical protein